jgi:hypothetical protein
MGRGLDLERTEFPRLDVKRSVPSRRVLGRASAKSSQASRLCNAFGKKPGNALQADLIRCTRLSKQKRNKTKNSHSQESNKRKEQDRNNHVISRSARKSAHALFSSSDHRQQSWANGYRTKLGSSENRYDCVAACPYALQGDNALQSPGISHKTRASKSPEFPLTALELLPKLR